MIPGVVLGPDGYLEGWEVEFERLLALYEFDLLDFSIGHDGCSLDFEDAICLPPLLQSIGTLERR